MNYLISIEDFVNQPCKIKWPDRSRWKHFCNENMFATARDVIKLTLNVVKPNFINIVKL